MFPQALLIARGRIYLHVKWLLSDGDVTKNPPESRAATDAVKEKPGTKKLTKLICHVSQVVRTYSCPMSPPLTTWPGLAFEWSRAAFSESAVPVGPV
jgi:hypothetical protein